VPEKDLVRISFQGTEKPDWIREGKEFRHQGRMFDIVRSVREDGKTVFYCIDDRKESLLVAKMEKLLHDSNSNGKNPASSATRLIVSLFPNLYFQETQSGDIHDFSFSNLLTFYFKRPSTGYPPALIIPPISVLAIDSI